VQINLRRIRLAADKHEAMRKWRRLVADGGLPTDRPLPELVEYYLPRLLAKSRRSCQQTFDGFLKHTGEILGSKLTKHHIRTFVKPEWAASTTRDHIKNILACLNVAVKHGLIPKHPIANTRNRPGSVGKRFRRGMTWPNCFRPPRSRLNRS
jgi:hypothetical protein